MHLKSHSFLQNKWCILLITFGLLFSCSKDDENDNNLPTITYVTFVSGSSTVEENASQPIDFSLSLSQPLEAPGTVTVKFIADTISTATMSDFTTSPGLNEEGEMVLNLEVGATSATFSLQPVDNEVLNEDKVVAFQLVDATKGLALGDSTLVTTLKILNNEEKQGDINISETQLEDFGEAKGGKASDSKMYTVSGDGLTDDVVVTASENFEVSVDDETFSSSIVITMEDVNAGPVDVFVRFAPQSGLEQDLTGTITHSAAGTYDKTLEVSGTETGGAEVFFNEDFEYGSSAGDITALSPWENYQGSEEPIQYLPEGLSFDGYQEATGGAIKIVNGGGSREDIRRAIPEQNSGSVYMAQLLNVKSASDGGFFQSLRDAGGTFYNRLYIKDSGDGSGFNVGTARTRSGGGSEVFGDKVFSYNSTILVVIKYDFETKETSLFVIDGDIPSEEPETPEAVANSGNEPEVLMEIVFRQSGDNIEVTVDAIKIGPSWEDVLGI